MCTLSVQYVIVKMCEFLMGYLSIFLFSSISQHAQHFFFFFLKVCALCWFLPGVLNAGVPYNVQLVHSACMDQPFPSHTSSGIPGCSPDISSIIVRPVNTTETHFMLTHLKKLSEIEKFEHDSTVFWRLIWIEMQQKLFWANKTDFNRICCRRRAENVNGFSF